jgi:hypothetical protein
MRLLFSILTISLTFSFTSSAQLIFPDLSEQSTAYLGGGGASSQHNVVSVTTTSVVTDNGAALIAAVGDITDAAEDNQYVIQLDSAIYDMGSSALTMKEFVHIRGMNRLATTITRSNTMTIHGASFATLSYMAITNTASGSTVYHLGSGDNFLFMVRIVVSPSGFADNKGILVNGTGTELGLDKVSIEVDGGSADNSGFTTYGIYIDGIGCEVEFEHSFMDISTTVSSCTVVGAEATSGNEFSMAYSQIESYNDGGGSATGVKINSGAEGWIIFSLI